MARILVSMKDDFLKTVDKVAQKDRRSRSELIREALRNYIKKQNISNPQKAQQNASILEELMD